MRPPSGNDWKSRVSSEVAAKVGNRRRERYAARIDIDVPHGGLLPLIREAAQLRGVSITCYARRALLAYIARDLELPFREVSRLDPRASIAYQRGSTLDPEGLIGGPWEIS